ncbi:hypothetical protein F3J34_11355 [Klebsiella sp. Ap-873]|nr:hypothetical protein [Klebsiella sp. Ap-873]
MANNNDIRIDIDGDVTGLQRALQSGERSIDEFGKRAGGDVGEVTEQVSKLAGGFATAMTGVAAAAAIGVGGITALVNSSREYVREMNEISKSTGLSVTELQQLSSAFSGLGLQMDKIGDINKDVLDHLGDAFRDGSGPAGDLKAYGVNLQMFNKYLNQTDGGIKAVIATFYEMKKAGKSQAEIVNIMETLASDSSHMIPVLNEFTNATDAMAYVQSQNASVSNEAAESYAKFDKNLTILENNVKGTIANALTPLVDVMNSIYTASNQKPHEAGLFNELNEQIKNTKGTLEDFYNIWQSLRQAGALNYQGAALHTGSMDNGQSNEYAKQKDRLNAAVNSLQGDLAAATAPKDGWKDKKKEAEEAAKKAEAARKAQQAAEAKAAEKRKLAERNLETALSQIASDGVESRIKQFDYQQKKLVDSIKASAKTLGLKPEQLNKYIDDAKSSAAFKRTELTNSMIGYSDPNKQIDDQNTLLGQGGLSNQQNQFIGAKQNQRLGLANTSYDLQQNNDAMNAELKQNELLLQSHEKYEKKKSLITAQYAQKAVEIQNQETTQLLQGMESAFGQIGEGMAAAFGKSSGAAKAAFAIQRGASIAMTILKIQEALAGALATPWPMNIANYAQIAGMGMSIISTAKGASSGQFHGGVDELPSNLDNKSFVLKQGERVVQPEANKKLSKFLDNQDSNRNSNGGEYTINAPLIIQGGSTDDDSKFNEMLKRHADSVNQAVRAAQRRNS